MPVEQKFVTGRIVYGGDPNAPLGAPFEVHNPNGDVFKVLNPLPQGDLWRPRPVVDFITLVVESEDGVQGHWIPSPRFDTMHGGTEEHAIRGEIMTDPECTDGWELKREEEGGWETVKIVNPLPVPPANVPKGSPHRWHTGDFITLNCMHQECRKSGWLPSPRFEGLEAQQ